MENLPSRSASLPPLSRGGPGAWLEPQNAAGTMSLVWRDMAPGTRLVEERAGVRVVLPLQGAAVVASLATRLGGMRQVAIADPAVCIVPDATRLELASERRSGLLVMALDAERWSERTREAIGLAAEIRECRIVSDPFIRRIAELLGSSSAAAESPGGGWVDAIAEDLSIHLATRYGRPAEAPAYAGLSPHRLQRVLATIDERLGESLPVHELAAEVGMSPYHFARMFKQSTGQAPHVYITWQRMDRAKELLARTSLPLSTIASRVGYRTQAHFTGVFHSRVGITPRAYRLRCRRFRARSAERAPQHEALA